MIPKPPECSTCYGFNWDRTQGFSLPEGSPVLGVVICGEALGENEAIDGLPFRPYAQAGSVLMRVLTGWHGCGLQREQFLIFNTIQCRPPANKLEGPWVPNVIQSCKVHRDSIIYRHKPKVILALGDVAMRTLTGFDQIKKARGYPVWNDEYECWIIGSFHPAYLARGNRNLCSVLREDIKRAVWLASQDDWAPADVNYQLQPTRDEAREFYRQVESNPLAPLALDVENPRITDEEEDEDLEPSILQIQFSLAPYTAIVFPWIGEFKEITEDLLRLPNPKWGHNSRKYDFPLLIDNGFEIAGELHDTMDAFRMVQSNLNGCYHLQGVGSFFGADQLWKHRMGENIEYYGAMDVDVTQRILSQLIPIMERLGVWDLYMRHVVEMEYVLSGMTDRGLNRDPDLIQSLRGESAAEMEELIDLMTKEVPRSILRFKDYKRTPADIKEIKLRLGGMTADMEEVEKQAAEIGYELIKDDIKGVFWRKWNKFVCSSDQLQDYCRVKGYTVPIHPKDDRPTMNEWAVKQLVKDTKDPFWLLVQKYQEVKTIKTRYLPDGLDRSKENWHPAEDGKTHSTFFSARTASGQFSSRNPNTQQIPR